jgi:competence protein ComEA
MGGRRERIVIFVSFAVIAVAAGAGAGILGRPSQAPPEMVDRPELAEVGGLVSVHVSGWVVSPGVVTVAEGAIVAEAIEAAGGLRLGARPETLNLADVVGPGDQIVVPGPESEASPGGQGSGGLLSLNTATETELQGLPGVGPVIAQRIVAYREQNGRFEDVEDLLEVPGIGEQKLASIRDLVRP